MFGHLLSSTNYGKQTLGFYLYIVPGCHFLGTLDDDDSLMMLRVCYFGGWMMVGGWMRDGWMMDGEWMDG